jgi:secreted PhoX family phosphatase
MINQDRRKFLKTSILFGAVFFLGKFFGSIFSELTQNSSRKNDFSERNLTGDSNVTYFDKEGNKILIVEK